MALATTLGWEVTMAKAEPNQDASAPWELLNHDVWMHVVKFLDGDDYKTLGQTCRFFRSLVDEHASLWLAAMQREFPDFEPYVRRQATTSPSAAEHHPENWKACYRRARAMGELRHACWHSGEVLQPGNARRFPRSEGHAMFAWGDYICISGGYTMQSLTAHSRAAKIVVSRELEAPTVEWVPLDERPLNGDPDNLPGPVYGHTCTLVSGDRAVKFGGVLYGGYHGAVDWLHVIHLKEQEDDGIQLRWEHVQPTGSGPGPCAYHCAMALPKDPSKLLVFGGLTDAGPISVVSLLDTNTWAWVPLEINGCPPEGRYGMTCAVTDDALWVIGGCSGGDIRRDGHDYRDVHKCDLSEMSEHGRVTWVPLPEIHVPATAAGRETCGVLFGRKIVMFGGSTEHMNADEVTNAVWWFDTRTLEFGQPRLAIEPTGGLPVPCLSAEAVLMGTHMVVYGGWTLRGLLGTFEFLNMAPLTEEARRLPEAQPEVTGGSSHGNAVAGNNSHAWLQLLMGMLQTPD
eukprot:m.95968 g.95968  ORF g.95968 m.95968 type:complete len:514 (+) comp15175_c0_seq1:3341-4882(+)